MRRDRAARVRGHIVFKGLFFCLLLLFLAACEAKDPAAGQMTPATATATQGGNGSAFQLPAQGQQGATPRPQATTAAARTGAGINSNRPVLAFYYPWYTSSSWCSCRMSDLPPVQYNSSDDATIAWQVNQAAGAGITGFISSWWGAGTQTDHNFAKLLSFSAALEQQTRYHFASTIYFESDAPALRGTTNMINALSYVAAHYSSDPHFFRWQGKPVIFFWNPLGNGRSLSQWAAIRAQVDPQHRFIWSAEGTNLVSLDVFDGIHLFSAAYWGVVHGTINAVDRNFRNQITAYNNAHHTQKIWAAGVFPGFDDSRMPNRPTHVVVARNNGATYRASWNGALSSSPDWVTVTSFNEWFEGSMIEPAVHYGDQYLQITGQYARQWHG